MHDLSHDDRLRLIQFVCSFAWADLVVQPEERALVGRIVRRLDLTEAERIRVGEWLEMPPAVDPAEVPVEHRRAFRDAIRATIESDGKVTEEEREALALFDQLA